MKPSVGHASLMAWRPRFVSSSAKHIPPYTFLRATGAPPQAPCLSLPHRRAFTTTRATLSWLLPKAGDKKKTRKGRPRVPTGGSTRGTTLVYGTYGLRLLDHHRRISAAQLKNGEDTIRKRLRGMKYRLYMRICANIGVYTSGNEVRMGKGKGRFDYWASRVAVSKVIFELKGELHEKVAREAFRLAGNKMPGTVCRWVVSTTLTDQASTSLSRRATRQSWASRR